jgi:hypothetical protein
MNDLQTARVLRAASIYLQTRGWIQYELGSNGGPRCMGGAICSATGLDEIAVKGSYDSDTILHICAVLGFENFGVGRWNDQPGRTIEEVLDRLESTALALEVRALAAETPAESKPELVPA